MSFMRAGRSIRLTVFSTVFVAMAAIVASSLSHSAVAAAQAAESSVEGRTKLRLPSGWQFRIGSAEAAYFQTGGDDAGWESVAIPHTLELASVNLNGVQDDKTQPTFHRKVGWYRRMVDIPATPDRRVFLEFEGVHQVTDLWVNGRHVGQHAIGGYTPFHFDITDYVTRGASNQIVIRADNRRRDDVPPDPGPFDYVKFGGLYRDVYLVTTDPLHVTFDWEVRSAGVRITTPTVNPVNKTGTAIIETAVRNMGATPSMARLVTRIVDARGVVVARRESSQRIGAGGIHRFAQTMTLEDDFRAWSPDDPYLYRVNTSIYDGERLADIVENPLGFRSFVLDPERGFLLNGKPIELIGFNRHQHYPYIGDALPDSLHARDVYMFKALGLNMIRTAHYPQDDALIEKADELGLLVYEEPPTWIGMSTDPRWYDRLEKSARAMVRNHRNHPSVVIWGAGINHRGGVARIHDAIKEEDATRMTASQNSRWTGWQSSGPADIYANMMYGDGLWDRSEPLLAMEGPSGPEAVATYLRDPLLTGLLSWTAHDYYTFHEPRRDQTSRLRRSGSVSMTAFRRMRDVMPWYPAEFLPSPVLAVEEQWRSDTKTLTIYSNAERVRLVLNGRESAVLEPSSDPKFAGLKHPPFFWDVVGYQPGTLEVEGVTAGKVVARTSLRTPEAARRLRLVVDDAGRDFQADGADIMVVHAEIVDANGTIVRDATTPVRFSVSGSASIVGDNADIGANPAPPTLGAAPALIRAGTQPGAITVTASAEGLTSDSVRLVTTPAVTDMIAAARKPIYDFAEAEVDLGGEGQLVQFGWQAWTGADGEGGSVPLSGMPGVTAAIAPGSSDGVIRWLGEMNVIGKDGYVFGDGVLGADPRGLVLTLSGLPAGTYRIKTWHHAPRSNTDSMDPNRERLVSLSIPSLPYADRLSIRIADAGRARTIETPVTTGREQQTAPVSTADWIFRSNGRQPVTITFSDVDGTLPIWLNGFRLQQWKEGL